MKKVEREHRVIARNQRFWASLAMRDYKYNMKQYHKHARKGNLVLARGYKMEAGWDLQWAHKRLNVAKRESKLGGKT